MAIIKITTSEDERKRVIEAIKIVQGETVPMTVIASYAGMNPNRVRYVITDLLEDGRIKREATKAYNKHYLRYKYFVVE